MRNKNRQATIDSLLKTNWELAVTLTFRYDITEARARKTLRRWWNEVDRNFYGNVPGTSFDLLLALPRFFV